MECASEEEKVEASREVFGLVLTREEEGVSGGRTEL